MASLPILNPVIAKELRSRMRGGRGVITLTFYLFVVGGFGLLSLYVTSQQPWLGSNVAFIGRSLLSGIVMVELFLICFITPAFTAGVIAGERERQTHDLILTTLLSPRSIVIGKLVSALAYVLLLIVAALPIQGLVFLIGGVAPEEVALVFILLLITALGIGSLSVLFSSLARTTLSATVMSYAAVLGIVVGTTMGYYMAGSITRSMPPEWLVYPNPFSAVGSVLSASGGSSLFPLPAPVPMAARPVMAVEKAVAPNGIAPDRLKMVEFVPIWEYYIVLYLATTTAALLASTFLIKPTHPWLSRLRPR